MEWFDISVPIRTGMATFDGDPEVRLERVVSMADGAVCNVSRLTFGVHSGTHVDAPVHFIDGGAGIERIAPSILIGTCQVVDLQGHRGPIDGTAVESLTLPEGTMRVLLKTPNSALWNDQGFRSDFSGVTADGASALIDRGVRLVGADYLSIAPFGNPTPTHRLLLEAGVVIVEGLDLRKIEPGTWELVCLPLLIPGSDGGPARALVGRPARPTKAGG
jgi:arylformamidase